MSLAAPGQLDLLGSAAWGPRTFDCFEKLDLVGEGTYGQVYKARDKETGGIFALKKIRMENEKEGFPITAIREIKILKKLKHQNVVNLKEIVTKGMEGGKHKGHIYMVFEYMDHDLAGLTEQPGMRFTIAQIKCYMKQILEGLHYCHLNNVLHRDIKSSNLLIDNNGILKLADFGLARPYNIESNGQLTNRVITLWYRPPELLLGSTKYGPAVDIWSAGCIFAELLTGKPLFPGNDEVGQLDKIFNVCGFPDEAAWPSASKLPHYQNLKKDKPPRRKFREHFRQLDRTALDLLEKMMALDPAKRVTAEQALQSEYFWSDPLPCDPSTLPKFDTPCHEIDAKRKRQQAKDEQSKKPRNQQGTAGGYPANQGAPFHNRMGPSQQAPYGQRQPFLDNGAPVHGYGLPAGGPGFPHNGGYRNSYGGNVGGGGRPHGLPTNTAGAAYVDIDAPPR